MKNIQTFRTVIFALTLSALFSIEHRVVAQSNIQRWEGILDVKVTTLKIRLELEFEGDQFKKGKLLSPDQGNAEINIDSFEINDNDVAIKIKGVGAEFNGSYSDDRKTLTGKFKQGREFDLELNRLAGEFAVSEHIETWKGILDVDPQKFKFLLKFYREQDGSMTARLDSLNEGLKGMKLELDRDDENCNFELKISAASYVGKLNEAKDRIEGTWTQRAVKQELNFEKIALNSEEPLNRPQHPKKPYPYAAEEVTFENAKDAIKLAGTFTKPKNGGPFPTVILITGSGPQDRDETLLGHKPFLVIADHLTRNGIAVLRFDERGVGESTGQFGAATTQDLSRDVEAAFEYLRTREDVAKETIGFVGHSEGGLIAPMIAARRTDVGMIVLLAGPGVSGREIGISQTRAFNEAAGVEKAQLDEQEEFLRIVMDELVENGTCSEEFIDGLVAETPETRAAAETAIATMDNPWFKYFLQYDPQPALKKVKCPVLILNGKKDLQVLADLNVDAIEAALKAGGNTTFESHKLENMNHLFQETKGPGLKAEYGQLEETFSPKALKIISDWLKKVTN